MPQVSINIANRTYELACGEGEEQRVQELASYVDDKVTAKSLSRSLAPSGVSRVGGWVNLRGTGLCARR